MIPLKHCKDSWKFHPTLMLGFEIKIAMPNDLFSDIFPALQTLNSL
jgi:hypothetical protein